MHQISLKAAFNYYDGHLRTINRSPESLKLNTYAKGLLTEFLGGEDAPVEKLDRYSAREFLLWLSDEKHLSKSSTARVYDVLRALCNYMVMDELMDKSPMAKVKRPKAEEVPIQPLSTEEVQAMLDVCNPRTFTGIRNRLIIAMLFDAGLRATELTSIEIENIDLDDRSILLRHTKGGKPRYANYNDTVSKLLGKYLLFRESLLSSKGMHSDQVSGGKLFITERGGNVDRHWLRIMIQRVGEKAGLTVYPHLLRHSCGVNLIMNGADLVSVQGVLGHATMTMARHYSQLADKDVKKKHKACSPADRLVLSRQAGKRRGPKPGTNL